MRKGLLTALAMIVAVSALVFSSQVVNWCMRCAYVEVRMASVFAAACHYNAEVVTTGRDALVAWNVTSGKWQNVDLSGVRAMAIVSSKSNLSEANAARQSEVIIDAAASPEQSQAMLSVLKEKYASSLGEIVEVRNTPITFEHKDRSYTVKADDATINVEAMPNDLCCKMPNLVWYKPLVGLENRKVGYTINATYGGHKVSEPWSRSGENSAFYGLFAL